MIRDGWGDDYDPCCWDCGRYPCDCDLEEIERQAWERQKARWTAMSPEELGKEWERECRRHDSAVDRCEALNSPTIEEAQGNMNWIEAEFEQRGLCYHSYVMQEEHKHG